MTLKEIQSNPALFAELQQKARLRADALARSLQINQEAQEEAMRLREGAMPLSIVRQLETNPYQWLAELIPAHFRGGAEAFALHHKQAINYIWSLQPGVAPQPPASIWPWSRGHMKSTLAEALAVAAGARRTRKLILYVCRTQGQADMHVRNVESMLLRSNIGKAYPELARPQIREVGAKKRQGEWTHAMLVTDCDFAVAGYGLLGAERGIRVEEFRPDIIIGDDIDKIGDSPGMVDKLLDALAATVIGTQSVDCVIVLAQNLIHSDSVVSRILERQTDVLSDREVIGPVPAVEQAEYEREHEHWYIRSGRPTWPQAMPLLVCEQVLNKLGKDVWDRECQHDVKKAHPDAIYPMWDPVYHIITWHEFFRFFGEDARDLDAPYGVKIPGWGRFAFSIDWGNNYDHPCAMRWVWWPEIQPLADSLFFYREQCWPTFPKREDDPRRAPSPVRVGRAIHEVELHKGIFPWKEQDRMLFRLASHERPEIREGFRVDLPAAGVDPISCQGIDTAQAREGILHMQSLLTIIQDEKHPFRRYPEGHPQAGQPLLGRPRAYFIVAPGQGELIWDARQHKLDVRPAIDENGQARTRFEYPRYRKPDTAQGTETKDPPKRDDDIIDDDRAITARLYPRIRPLTHEERIQLQMRIWGYDDEKRPKEPDQSAIWEMSRQYHAAVAKKKAEELHLYGLGLIEQRERGEMERRGWEEL